MKANSKSIFGVFPTWKDAENALTELQKLGFTHKDISLLVHAENVNKDALAPEKHTKTPQGVAAGVASGAILGGGLGLLAGLGSLMIPGVGPMLAIGPILGAFSGAGMGGAAGGIVGAFIGVGIPQHHADYLQEAITGGGILLAVHVEDHELQKQVYEVLKAAGAGDTSSSEHEAISSVDDISPTFATRPLSPKQDFIQRKQF